MNILQSYFIFFDDNTSSALWPVLQNFQFWLVFILCLGCVVAFEVSVRGAKIMFRPTLTNILSELHLHGTDSQKAELKLSADKEEEWRKRKTKKHAKNRMNQTVKLPTMSEEEMKGVVRVMMRFRHLTGEQFEVTSAYNALQQNDHVKNKKEEEKLHEEDSPGLQENPVLTN